MTCLIKSKKIGGKKETNKKSTVERKLEIGVRNISEQLIKYDAL